MFSQVVVLHFQHTSQARDASKQMQGRASDAVANFVLFTQNDRCLDVHGVSSLSSQACSTVEEPLCKEVLTESNYMTPVLPEQQKNLNLEHYRALVHINCSEFTRLFVCLAHMPLCTPHYPHLQAL